MGAHVINPDQLKFLMTGTELRSYITASNDRGADPLGKTNETLDEMWDRKAANAAQPAGATFAFKDGRTGEVSQLPYESAGVKDSLREKGYVGPPVQVSHHKNLDGSPLRMIPDVHTRIASAADLERTEGKTVWFPVEHRD